MIGGMRNTSALVVLTLVLLTPWTDGPSVGSARASGNAGPELEAALQATAAAWNGGDIDGFMAPYAAAATYMTPAGVIGVPAMRARYLAKYFTGNKPDQQLRFDQLDVRALGADHTLMTGRYTLAGGGKPDQTGRFSLVWMRTAQGWKILHDHSS
jgi:ketosteroid isomerase-like protein